LSLIGELGGALKILLTAPPFYPRSTENVPKSPGF
jgi:hypothetical protein